MSTDSTGLQHLNLGIDSLTNSVVLVMDAAALLQHRLANPPVNWTLNSSACSHACQRCRYHPTCWNYGDPALRRSATTTGLSLSA